MLKNVKCARCVRCGKEYEAVPNLTNCSCGGILDIVYDYDYIKAHLTKETLKNRVNPTMWRYRDGAKGIRFRLFLSARVRTTTRFQRSLMSIHMELSTR